MNGGMPLMEALKARLTTRNFADKPLTTPTLSNLLWAAAGVNRPDAGKRTAPTAMNCQEIDVYVARADGLWLYDAKPHALRRILEDDIRAKTGGGKFAGKAPICLIYVADYARMAKVETDANRAFYAATDTGFISQNVYLFCASERLATVVHDGIKRTALSKAMRLRPDQKIILGQCVGHPE
jgi:SagB-type dehydrogenase family enzyme